MRLTSVTLRNIRCIERLTLRFARRGASLLIAGDNGAGKSTVLRAIAIGLCDESSAAALFREIPGNFVKKDCGKGTITIELMDTGAVTYTIETTITPLKAFERLTQKVWQKKAGKKRLHNQDTFPWRRIFVSGYGSGLRTQGTADFQKYLAVDAVYPLFRYDEPLQNPELAIRRIIDLARAKAPDDPKLATKRANEKLAELGDMICTTLDLPTGARLRLTSKGITVKGPWGTHDLPSLGDGYRSTIIWLLDLLMWRILYHKNLNPQRMAGIALIDEIEQHLHPKWQLNIMRELNVALPAFQFIATTHSPLVTSGCWGIPIQVLEHREQRSESVYGWLAHDVYREVMSLASTRPPEILENANAFRRLHLKNLSKRPSASEKAKMLYLKRKLRCTLPPTDPLVTLIELENLSTTLSSP
ncbi:MAG: AAA family ATPase [Phycisphaerae bacterium]